MPCELSRLSREKSRYLESFQDLMIFSRLDQGEEESLQEYSFGAFCSVWPPKSAARVGTQIWLSMEVGDEV